MLQGEWSDLVRPIIEQIIAGFRSDSFEVSNVLDPYPGHNFSPFGFGSGSRGGFNAIRLFKLSNFSLQKQIF